MVILIRLDANENLEGIIPINGVKNGVENISVHMERIVLFVSII